MTMPLTPAGTGTLAEPAAPAGAGQPAGPAVPAAGLPTAGGGITGARAMRRMARAITTNRKAAFCSNLARSR